MAYCEDTTNPKNSDFQYIDAQGKKITELNADDIKQKYCVLIRNHQPPSEEEIEEFSLRFGHPIYYNNKAALKFESLDEEAESHYDGISNDDPTKHPTWMTFYFQQVPDVNQYGGRFLITDCAKALKNLSEEDLNFLRQTKLNFYGSYWKYGQKPVGPNDFTVAIPVVNSFEGTERLRVAMLSPGSGVVSEDGSKVYSQVSKFSMLFEGASAERSLELFNAINNAVDNEEVTWSLALESNDLLMVNNQYVFHGRQAPTQSMQRAMYRVQLCDAPTDWSRS